jgi:GT2 family glycosyltransferase/glycosyltransferase involved in cell wall biosynthesis
LLHDFFLALPAALAGIPHHEIIVVDNASSDDTLSTVHRLAPNVTVVERATNEGYAAGVNAGIAVARPSDAVLILNPDVRLRPGSVAALMEILDQPGVGIAVPRILGEDGSIQHSLYRAPSIMRAWGAALLGGRRAGRTSLLGETIVDDDAYSSLTNASWASGAAMAISKQCLQAVGPWNESFFLYSEETEFCLRAGDAGFATRLQPRAEAVHIGGEMTSSPRLWAMQAWNRVRLYRARHGRLASSVFRAGVVVNEALRAVRGSAVHRAGLASVLFASARPPEVAGALKQTPAPRDLAGYIAFSAQDFWYHNRAHSDIQLMRNVAANRRVLFVNSIAMRMPMPGRSTKPLRRIWRKAKSMAKLIRRPIPELPNFHVMTPVMIPLYGSPLARRLNAALVRVQVGLAARALGMANPVYVVTIPTAWDVVQKMPRRCLVYNRSDLHSSFPEADRALIASFEGGLLRQSDYICYVSRALLKAESHLTDNRAIFLDHGVDLHHFRTVPPEEQPVDVRHLPRPRIGFFGGLDDYIIDFDLLERIAREFPDASVVLVGDATCSMKRYEQYPNVYWLGFRPYEQIPAYGSGFDVALMPWLDNEWIHHSNPIKLKEYLALGLPVVTTEFPEAHYYADHVAIAGDDSAFIDAIRRALASPPDPAKQRASIRTMSWQDCAATLIGLCESVRQPGTRECP